MSEKDFQWRGREVTRLESFSDAAFGFALTLLVVSLDVPKNFGDLMHAMSGVPGFAVCFVMLAVIWYRHFQFSRRYGLQDARTTALTLLLLFITLIYIYPLKFLYGFLLIGDGSVASTMTMSQVATLFEIFGAGFAAIEFCFFLMYCHAYAMRDDLELTPVERVRTSFLRWKHLSFVAVGLLSIVVAAIPSDRGIAGWTFVLMWPVSTVENVFRRRALKALENPTLPVIANAA